VTIEVARFARIEIQYGFFSLIPARGGYKNAGEDRHHNC
jgi:hypothetical protein